MTTRIPSDKIARVSSYDTLGSVCAMPVGALVAGPLSAAIGVPSTEFAAATLMVVVSALTFIPRDIRTIRSAAPTADWLQQGDTMAEKNTVAALDALATDVV
jgi:hypothetical protein